MKRTKDYVPLMMTAFLFVMVAALGAYRVHTATVAWFVNVRFYLICAYLLWLVFETRISKKDVDTKFKDTKDSFTCQLYGSGQALTAISALLIPSVDFVEKYQLLFFVLFVIGAFFRFWAIITLGEFYSHRVRQVEEHLIVTSGPYRVIRHPAYLGMLLGHVGFVGCFFNWISLGILIILLLPALFFRIHIEEKMLFQIDGYSKFAQKRKRLFPFIW